MNRYSVPHVSDAPVRTAEVEALFRTYPRTRPELTPAHRESYVEHYRANRNSDSGLSRIVMRLESWMHRRAAEDCHAKRVLEIGAGTLNHVRYHPGAEIYDAVEPFRELWEDSPMRDRVDHLYADLADVPEKQRYDRIVSIAVLEHLTHLPLALARSGLLLAEGGEFRAGFPSEGGMLWGLAWRTTTGLKYRLDRGLDYGSIMRHEHLNSANDILTLLHYFFQRVDLRRFPTPVHHLSFYASAIATAPRADRCRDFLLTADGRFG